MSLLLPEMTKKRMCYAFFVPIIRNINKESSKVTGVNTICSNGLVDSILPMVFKQKNRNIAHRIILTIFLLTPI